MDDAEGKAFLSQFPKLKRSLIMNMFLAAIREGKATTATDVLLWVMRDANRRLGSQYASEGDRGIQKLLIVEIDSTEALLLAKYCLWWESLSVGERDRIKRQRGSEYAKDWMATQSPTEKQLKYLDSLGCSEKPTTRLRASELIEQWKQ